MLGAMPLSRHSGKRLWISRSVLISSSPFRPAVWLDNSSRAPSSRRTLTTTSSSGIRNFLGAPPSAHVKVDSLDTYFLLQSNPSEVSRDPHSIPEVSPPPPDIQIELPEDSQLALLDKCMTASVSRGVDLDAPFEPSFFVESIQSFISVLREATGCSWIAAAVVCAWIARLLASPLAVKATKDMRRSLLLTPIEISQRQEIEEAKKGGREEEAKRLEEKLAEWQKLTNFSPFPISQLLNVAVQSSIFLGFYRATSSFAERPDIFKSHALEKPLWLDSVALPDPYGLLSLMAVGALIFNVEVARGNELAMRRQAELNSGVPDKMLEEDRLLFYKWALRSTICLGASVSCGFPSTTVACWIANSSFTLFFNLLMRSKSVERLVDMPPLDPDGHVPPLQSTVVGADTPDSDFPRDADDQHGDRPTTKGEGVSGPRQSPYASSFETTESVLGHASYDATDSEKEKVNTFSDYSSHQKPKT
uniref:Uncharacterized protein n=1 Tax=Chromera velia CCMP2878 TaxID=1169474 RepID=A0A0G4I3W7_9ALVE|eukprot:Cvel_10784.t1-p1 / transcript=Cvel_10784.t1 / gene=Cvel_10784 / organism=Chromera_velia_CCMP2878 / gene_product=hypothetical protein / transcript_product=hypothetical protein / location=Cvel_scaffold659:15665-18643(+) / protein_length=475 / sequence_SO=supercontig / SO=protein_coding / is_pseudo=false